VPVASLAMVYAAGEGKDLTEVVHLTGDTRSVICWKESCEPVTLAKLRQLDAPLPKLESRTF
jgi:hypothetical protein